MRLSLIHIYLECNDEGDLVQTVERTATSLEDVIKQPFQVIKAANNGKTDADLLKGCLLYTSRCV